jgi:hypothetical protein
MVAQIQVLDHPLIPHKLITMANPKQRRAFELLQPMQM